VIFVFVDNGLLRRRVRERNRHDASAFFHLNLIPVDGAPAVLEGAATSSPHPERTQDDRRVFIDFFDEHASTSENAQFWWQGNPVSETVIESVSVKGPSAVIKSHHNVGACRGMKLKLIEPLCASLFKDEVRRGPVKRLGTAARRAVSAAVSGPGLPCAARRT